ncbi:hypothetical protein L596_022340 [Steinernema carpocapsae]|uniref:EF-hand domain-containing protein n=1 Tax=Steinernema carpocapsae TaxID=34508 RepID=A0A4U5MLD4_STECR|nr:hypothetical protein L596_022340 [Steinernema carpocapsae]
MFSTVLFISLFVSAYGQAVPYNPESPEAAFQRMDTDNNGLITVEDYFHRDPWYTQYTQKTFGDMDVNGRFRVDF